MYTVIWDQPAFDQMHALLLWHPDRRDELARVLRIVARELSADAGSWGESRSDQVRLGYVGALSLLVLVDPQHQSVRVLEVRLQPT